MSLYVDELFQELSQLPADQREAVIVERCANDPAAEAQLRALLSAEVTFSEPLAIETGTELERYRLERKLGEGATASVWQAWDTHLRAYTALKLLHPENVRGDGALRVVLHEARAASSIISDHVVRIKTAGRLQDGPPFIEMELCAEYEPTDDGSEALTIGSSLSEVTLPTLAEKVRVVAEAARGVEAAHRLAVLHRDLKPGNILLTPVSRRAKVTDFGLAADQVYPPPTEATGPARTVTVQTSGVRGAIVGTPAYMPPEQARGEPPTRATDVYGLGATLYALIAGDHPYLAEEEARVPALDVLAQVRRGPPAPVRSRARVPARLAAIIERAMARSPRRRYSTAAAFADDLEAWLGGYATAVDGRAPLLRAALFVGRHRTAALTIVLLLLVLIGFG
ncbi:MAG: serine/threonine-protein kinase, partial [Myxococcota bacterium]